MIQVRGKLKCPLIICWLIFGLNLLYLLIIFLLRKYISLLFLILDIEILFNIEVVAILLTIGNRIDQYILFQISFILTIVNLTVILFSIFIIIFAFFDKKSLSHFIIVEPWIVMDGKSWMGVLFIFVKFIEIIPFVLLIISKKKLSNPVGVIRALSINGEEALANKNDDKLI